MHHDPDAFVEVLVNLLSNAYKYSPRDDKRLAVTLGPVRGRVVLAVEDNGPGVPVRERRRIFEQFYRADDLLTREVEGTGLGLSIVRNIVQAHGGRILVEDSELGGGRFVVILPAVARSRKAAAKEPAETSMSNARILVIEDDPSIRLGLRKTLGFEGYTVLEAADGEQGLEIAFEQRPDLVVVDLMLPRLNGYEVVRTIRKHDKSVPLLILSAKGQEVDKLTGFDLGVDDYVTKPFSARELVARIKAALRRASGAGGDETYTDGRIQVDFPGQRLTVAGEAVEVSNREFRLLRYLIENRGRVLSRDQILNKVWGYDYEGTARTIDNFINKLRTKIELDPAEPTLIQTVRGVGYKFGE